MALPPHHLATREPPRPRHEHHSDENPQPGYLPRPPDTRSPRSGPRLKLNRSSGHPRQEPTRLAAAKAGFDMGIPFNELNRIFDLGFKPLPWGGKGYLP